MNHGPPIKIRFTLYGQDAELLRSLQRWIRDNDYPASRREDGVDVPAGPALGLPQDPDEIARRQFVNFLYSSIQQPNQGANDGAAQTSADTEPDSTEVQAAGGGSALLEQAASSGDTTQG